MSDAEQKVRKILDSVVKENFPDASEVKIKPIDTNAVNYTSVCFVATISTSGETVELFAKVATMGGQMSDMKNIIFDREDFIYSILSSAYEKLQDKHKVDDRFVFPKSYKKSLVDGVPIIVMENLTSKGYECLDRFKFIDWKYASKCTESLARFHALSLAFKKYYPEEFTKVEEAQSQQTVEGSDWGGLTDGAMAAVDHEDREKLSRLFEDSVGWSKTAEFGDPCKTSVIIHGDYRSSNLMHKNVNEEYHVIPVDYQTVRLGCPASDLIYFIIMGSDQQFRRQYFHQLVDHYYHQLVLAMTTLGLAPEEEYGRKEFDSDMKAKLPLGLCVAATTLPYVTTDRAPSFAQGQYVPRANELFAERFRELVEDFKLWGII